MAENTNDHIPRKKIRRGPYGKTDCGDQEYQLPDTQWTLSSLELSANDDNANCEDGRTVRNNTESEDSFELPIDFDDEIIAAPEKKDDEPQTEFNYNTVTENDLQTEDPELEEILARMHESNEELENEHQRFECESDEDESALDDSKEAERNDYDFRPLYPGASVTVGAFMLLLALFTTNYGIVSDGTQVLLNIIAFALPSEHNLCTKLHEYKKFFTNLRIPLVSHYYCGHCLGSIENTTLKTCPFDFCQKPFNKKDGNYFLEIPLQHQIKNLFAQEDFYEKIQHRFSRNTAKGTYEDIYDGKIYKSHFENDGFLSNPNNISFTFNTDGAAVFKSSKVSVWPIFLVINELPYKIRMKRENMILASLWFGSQKPAMGTFLKPFQKSMKGLYEGIECFSPQNGTFTSKGILLCGTADLPARSILCNHIQYNGAFACWKCEQQGTSASVGKGQARVFPFDTVNPKGPERTAENVVSHAREALQNIKTKKASDSVVKGIKGPSWLSFFPTFSIVNGIAIDYMHGVLLGVQKLLLELWFLQKHSSKPFNFYNKLCETDERLLSIRPTLDITRLPRTIQNDLKYWKASEFRSFLLFYGAPVLHGILDKQRFSHYLLLVNAMHILLKCGSSDEDIDKAEKMLFDFCKNFEALYAKCYMRLNVHQLLHLPDSVRYLGPLYTHSCFSFEDKNGALIRMIRGTQHIDSQIITGVSFLQKLPELKEKCIEKGSFCETLYNSMESPYLLKRGEQIAIDVYILGGIKEKSLTLEENIALYTFFGYELVPLKFKTFNRLEFKQYLIYGKAYSRMVKRDNSTVEYHESSNVNFGQVRFFISIIENDKQYYLAFIEKLKCSDYGDKRHIHSVTKTNELQVVPLENIISSCMLLSYGATSSFVCRFPNRMESD